MTSTSSITERLDKILEQVGQRASSSPLQGGHTGEDREIARVVKRTEVATPAHKRNLMKYIIIGIAIILLLVGIVYFVAKTKYGQIIKGKLLDMLPGQKRKRPENPQNPRSKLVAQEVDFRSQKASDPTPPLRRPVIPPSVKVPQVQNEGDGELDPGAVRFARRTPAPPPNLQPPPQTLQTSQPPQPQPPRGPSPPVDDTGPPEVVTTADTYEKNENK